MDIRIGSGNVPLNGLGGAGPSPTAQELLDHIHHLRGGTDEERMAELMDILRQVDFLPEGDSPKVLQELDPALKKYIDICGQKLNAELSALPKEAQPPMTLIQLIQLWLPLYERIKASPLSDEFQFSIVWPDGHTSSGDKGDLLNAVDAFIGTFCHHLQSLIDRSITDSTAPMSQRMALLNQLLDLLPQVIPFSPVTQTRVDEAIDTLSTQLRAQIDQITHSASGAADQLRQLADLRRLIQGEKWPSSVTNTLLQAIDPARTSLSKELRAQIDARLAELNKLPHVPPGAPPKQPWGEYLLSEAAKLRDQIALCMPGDQAGAPAAVTNFLTRYGQDLVHWVNKEITAVLTSPFKTPDEVDRYMKHINDLLNQAQLPADIRGQIYS
jgi:hypothetical protein